MTPLQSQCEMLCRGGPVQQTQAQTATGVDRRSSPSLLLPLSLPAGLHTVPRHWNCQSKLDLSGLLSNVAAHTSVPLSNPPCSPSSAPLLTELAGNDVPHSTTQPCMQSPVHVHTRAATCTNTCTNSHPYPNPRPHFKPPTHPNPRLPHPHLSGSDTHTHTQFSGGPTTDQRSRRPESVAVYT